MSAGFSRFAGFLSIAAALCGFLYAVALLILQNSLLFSLCLLLVGLLTTAPLAALYERVKPADNGLARWAYTLALAGALGSAIHGGYDLANTINAPNLSAAALPNLPNQVDPRGLLTFGASGIGLAALAWLMPRGGFPRWLASIGIAAAGLNLVLYVGRLIILDTSNPLIFVPVLLNGFILIPVFYLWLGLRLWRQHAP